MSHFDSDLLFEAIQIRDGVPRRLALHQARMNRSRQEHFSELETIDIASLIDVPDDLRTGVVKCRISYGESIGRIEYTRYVPRKHDGVMLIDLDRSYGFKYNQREWLNRIEAAHPDKLVIIVKDERLTDATYANIALYDGVRWVTPEHCLLKGTMREWLLAEGIVIEHDITLQELDNYRSVKVLNALTEWDEAQEIPLHPYTILSNDEVKDL